MLSPVTNPYLLNSQIYQIFRRYDKDFDGHLNFLEFSEFLLPSSDKLAANELQRRESATLSSDGRFLIVKLLKSFISANGSHEYIRLRLRRSLHSQ